jgi:hypothetical protein
MKTSITILVGTAFILSGCSVMHFKNGSVETTGRTVESWHHNLALSLYEASPPLNMEALCADRQWSMVTTKVTFSSGVAGMVGNSLWSPQIAHYTCGK